MAAVSFEAVTKRYGGSVVAVDDMWLDVRDTEFMVIVGPSGCGKSTALRLLAGVDPVTSGVIRIGERIVNDVPTADRDVAMVFQSFALYPGMTVLDNLRFPLVMRQVPTPVTDVVVREAARILGIERLLGRRPGELSGGEQQRVALGRAIVRNPTVYLLDEPLSSLDAGLRAETRVQLRRLHDEMGATFVCVTHDEVEAMTMATRVGVMKDGSLRQVGTPKDIYERPVDTFVAGFFGTPHMNLVTAVVRDQTAVGSGFAVPLRTGVALERILLGIRPEHLEERVSGKDAVIDLRVELVELLGSSQILHGTCGGDTMAARVRSSLRVRPGMRIRLGIDSRHVHVFDPETGLAVGPEAEE